MIRPSEDTVQTERGLPKPHIKKMRWPYPLIWLIPLAAAVAAGFYFQSWLRDHGRLVTVEFSDGTGLRPSETPVTNRGIPIGTVTGMRLSDDHKRVLVEIRLMRSADTFARQNTQYWIVRPEFSASGISGLQTISSGPFVATIPGDGPYVSEFTGREKPPTISGEGIYIMLHAPRLEQFQAQAPVYFRGIEVGIIRDTRLSRDADGVDIEVFINRPYAPLVRMNSKFWIASGIDVKGGILTGMQMKLDSLRSLLQGGVTFATPDVTADPAQDGAQFPLYGEPEKDWLNWSPKIAIEPE
jgi:paraquat-inducible protein B